MESDGAREANERFDEHELVDHLLTLTPRQRFERHARARELARALRKAGAKLHGIDPRPPEET